MKAFMSKKARDIMQTAEGREKLRDATIKLTKKNAGSTEEIEVNGKKHSISLVREIITV